MSPLPAARLGSSSPAMAGILPLIRLHPVARASRVTNASLPLLARNASVAPSWRVAVRGSSKTLSHKSSRSAYWSGRVLQGALAGSCQRRRGWSSLQLRCSAEQAEVSSIEGSQTPFVFEAEEINAACRSSGMTPKQYLTSALAKITPLARPPISKFHVAAIGLGESGRAYAGVNLEIPGLPLHNSVHAEQFVVANAMQHGERKLLQILVNHPPCGHCRQFMQEMRNAEDISIVIADAHAEEQSLHHFLPHRFGPKDLLGHDFPLLLEARDNRLRLLDSITGSSDGAAAAFVAAYIAGNGASSGNGAAAHSGNGGAATKSSASQLSLIEATQRANGDLVDIALAAANASYAPYSMSPSGVALRLRSGEVVAGSYMESAAYNPSLPPLQAAMVAIVSQTNKDFSTIDEAVLVEVPGANVEFAMSTRIAVEHLSPYAAFSVYYATPA